MDGFSICCWSSLIPYLPMCGHQYAQQAGKQRENYTQLAKHNGHYGRKQNQ